MEFGAPWWRLIGSFLLVAGVLVLTLKLLGQWQGRRLPGEFRLLDVSPLGPRRSVERLQYRDEELIIYRSEGAMLLVDRQPAKPAGSAPSDEGPATLARSLKRVLGRR